MTRSLHISLNVRDLEKSVAFYRALFDQAPDKTHGDYVRFLVEDPPLVLTLNVGEKVRGGNQVAHLGLRVDCKSEVEQRLNRLRKAGYWIKEQRDIVCCYSRQDKFWVRDPDDNHWEVYELVDDMLGDDAESRRPESAAEFPR